MDHIKVSIMSLTDLDNLYDLREFMDDVIIDWKKQEIEFDDEDLED